MCFRSSGEAYSSTDGESRSPALAVKVIRRPAGITRVIASGEIDWVSVGQLDRALEHEPAADTSALIVDLSEVGFCASCGLHLLVSLRKRAEAADVPLELVVSTYAVRRPLEASGLWPTFSVHETHDAALGSLGASDH
ncbi:STAS domain-containing protein [Amycolatopsis pigmentata]|uniref:STAS domain-containing protein n=1 Tax=Amycolatopsis pigmentata TaxID=450801 RepID=A0ABW5G3L8_9PSEU